MKVYLISDEDYKTAVYEKLLQQVLDFFESRGFEIEQKSIKRGELHFCLGCFGCWAKTPGECVIKDNMAEINRTFINSDVVVYLSPIVFGQSSPNIKHALDRWLPNVLPLFEKKPDGTSGHPPRYKSDPKSILIGYGNAVSSQDAQLFTDIAKHKPGTEVVIFSEEHGDISDGFKKIKFERVVHQQ